MTSPDPSADPVEILHVLRERWSAWRFQADRPVDDAQLNALLEAARWAPSSFNEQPWRFLVARVGEPQRTAMEATVQDKNDFALRAPLMICVVAKSTFTLTGEPNPSWAFDVGLATMSMVVQATAEGLSVHQIGGFDRALLRESFEIPEEFIPVVILAVGWHDPALDDDRLAEKERRDRARLSRDDLAFGRPFGQPYRPSS